MRHKSDLTVRMLIAFFIIFYRDFYNAILGNMTVLEVGAEDTSRVCKLNKRDLSLAVAYYQGTFNFLIEVLCVFVQLFSF